MIPAVTAVRMTGAARRAELPLLVLGPSLGTSAQTLWGACASRLTQSFDVLAWDLPGHGHNRAVPDEPYSMADLAHGVLRVVDDVLLGRDGPDDAFFYAGMLRGRLRRAPAAARPPEAGAGSGTAGHGRAHRHR